MPYWLLFLLPIPWAVCRHRQRERRRLTLFQQRSDHRTLWMGAICAEDQSRVEVLLSAICDAFLIPLEYRFRLRPLDDIHAFYQRNMRGAWADVMEYETLMIDLEREFGFSADTIDRLFSTQPCTVGALVRLITRPRERLSTTRAS